jgi:hypothetical protein
MNPHDRVTLQQAALLSRYFKFREPCTRSLPTYTYKKIDGKDVRFDFSLQVPTNEHAVDFLNRKGHECSLETLSDFLLPYSYIGVSKKVKQRKKREK